MDNIACEYRSIKEIKSLFTIIRRMGKRPVSNYFNQCDSIDVELKSWKSEHTIVFEWIDMNIKRIYFYSSDLDELANLLSLVDKGSVVDFITKEKDVYSELFVRAGFRKHLDYGRFYIKPNSKESQELYDIVHGEIANPTNTPNSKESQELYDIVHGEIANPTNTLTINEDNGSKQGSVLIGERALVSDAEEIDKQLREEFDPYEAHFYSIEKLREHIEKGWVWVVKENNEIIAANLFEVQGCKSYGAYLYNRGNIDVLCNLIARTDEYSATLGVTYSYCWMRLNNKRIIRYNMKVNGYVPDGLYDIIYVKE